jgi:hypothetical protein
VKVKHITPSERAEAACLHRWFLKYGAGIVPRSTKTPLIFGRIWGEAIDVWFDADLFDASRFVETYPWPEEHDPFEVADVRQMLLRMLEGYDRTHCRSDFVVLAKELPMSAPVITPNGRASARTGTAGRLDWLVQLGNRNFVLERKTTGKPLSLWRIEHAYKPQAPTYCGLVQRELGIRIDGIIYDLAFKGFPLRANELKAIKSGKRLAKPAGGVPKTTASEWLKAVVPFGGLDAEDWYRDAYEALVERELEGHWFRREVVPISQDEIERAIREEYHANTALRRGHDRLVGVKETIRAAAKVGDPSHFGKVVADVVQRHGAAFPRNAAMCRQWGRCPFTDLCRFQSPEAASLMTLRKSRREELESTS